MEEFKYLEFKRPQVINVKQNLEESNPLISSARELGIKHFEKNHSKTSKLFVTSKPSELDRDELYNRENSYQQRRYEQFPTIRVTDFSPNINIDAFRDMFEKHGDLQRFYLPTDNNDELRGFGYVSYYDEKDCETAIKEINGTRFDNRVIHCSKARPRK
ncbi:eukaryotic translation initiation factor 3 subunit g [Anaeramoeba flamelloides]|uniref:Eukaryotic translation initiation factor 3 subunit g n=1 Tax=Anaeramoeba flamelloides TaxID=1746091 RepID=A0AAV7YKW0_9EUKA|nr:eukaryotic translation initiation factor 3 subunit g [Anaeramoeba flamelloides]KAJ6231311.1 eukaryotic translation initiation factor 3 subunit g [Anaeramoeba flamelloides]